MLRKSSLSNTVITETTGLMRDYENNLISSASWILHSSSVNLNQFIIYKHRLNMISTYKPEYLSKFYARVYAS